MSRTLEFGPEQAEEKPLEGKAEEIRQILHKRQGLAIDALKTAAQPFLDTGIVPIGWATTEVALEGQVISVRAAVALKTSDGHTIRVQVSV